MNQINQLDFFPSKISSWEDHSIWSEVELHVFNQFKRFHKDNPNIFILFKRFSSQLRDSGRTRYGAKAIMERIRWHVNVETSGSDFKISNSVTSCYPRLLILEQPEYESFFSRHNKDA